MNYFLIFKDSVTGKELFNLDLAKLINTDIGIWCELTSSSFLINFRASNIESSLLLKDVYELINKLPECTAYLEFDSEIIKDFCFKSDNLFFGSKINTQDDADLNKITLGINA